MPHGLLKALAPHMIVGLGGARLSADERSLLAEYPFAGVILFERNVSFPRGLLELDREIRTVFAESRGVVPIVAADHEGGVISVLGQAIGVPPTQAAAARAGGAALCERLFAENARRMRTFGVNMLLGPVADVNSDPANPVIGTRSFGETAAAVSPLVAAAVSAARRERLLTCLKHFPGHGPSSVDSHLALPVLDATLDDLRSGHLPPFASGIAAGAETVMMGHIAPRGRSLPASLDPEIIGGLLRGELGFRGAVMTDALEMEGVKVATPVEILARALEAGNDILLFSKPVGEIAAGEAFTDSAEARALIEKIESGVFAPLRERVEKLLSIAATEDREFNMPSDPAIYREIAAKAVEVTRGEQPVHISRGNFNAVFYAGKGEFERIGLRSFITRLLKAMGNTGAGAVEEFLAPIDPGAIPDPGFEGRMYPAGDRPAGSPDAVFLLNRRPVGSEAVSRMCAEAPVVVVGGWPHAARFVPPKRTVVTTFGVYDAAADAVSQLLLEP